MTKSSIVVLTPEIVAAVFAELECTGEGEPTEKGWSEIMETCGIGIVATNAVRRAFERMGWTSAWPLLDHMERFFLPLADGEVRERAAAVMRAARERRISGVPSEESSPGDPEDFEAWALGRSPIAECFIYIGSLAHLHSDDHEGQVAATIWIDPAITTVDIAQLLATDISDSAAREFVTSIEALGREVQP